MISGCPHYDRVWSPNFTIVGDCGVGVVLLRKPPVLLWVYESVGDADVCTDVCLGMGPAREYALRC